MTDLETRLREGLHGDVEQPDLDGFLSGVQRGAAWRRGRRASAVVAVAVAALVGGSVLLQSSRDDQVAPAPTPITSSPTSTPSGPDAPQRHGRVVDASVAGSTVFRLTSDLGCTACSSAWRLGPSGTWEHLYDFAGRAAYGGRVDAAFGPVDTLTMAPNGRDGWAEGYRLWSTHDGGQTWSIVSDGPGAHTVFGRTVGVGTKTAWVLRRSISGGSLWRTHVGSDAWQRATGVPRLHELTGFGGVLADDRAAVLVSGEGGSGNALVVGTVGSWNQVPLPSGADLIVRTDGAAFWASVPETGGVDLFRLETSGVRDLGRVGTRNWFPLDGQRVLLDRPTAAVFSTTGIEQTDLRLGHGRVLRVTRADDGTFWLVTLRGRIYSSPDGLHWTAQP